MLTRREILQIFSVGLAAGFAELVQAFPAKARLLFVHGRGQGSADPLASKAEWLASLSKGLAGQGLALPPNLSVSYPFYGAELDKFVAQWDGDTLSDVQAKGTAVDERFLSLQAEIAEDLRVNAGISQAQVDAEYGYNPKPKGPQNWEWVLAIIRAIDRANVGVTELTIENFTRDVFLYLNRQLVQDSVNKIVANDLTEEPTIIVAHSLGSIVAYNLLRSATKKYNVPLLITIGSPLGIHAINKNFFPLRNPLAVAKWYNAYDAKDVVALRPLSGDYFPIQPEVENNNSVKNWTPNHHSAVGYLDDKEISLRVLRALV